MQKLTLPIENMLITAGYKNSAYRNKFGFSHFGQDCISTKGNNNIYASGIGRVLALGEDSLLGNVLIISYQDAFNTLTEQSSDLVIRYFHLNSISVQVGQLVVLGTKLGAYGNTGRYSAGPHLHLEADWDTKYFACSGTVGKDGTIIKAGTVKTMCNPSTVLFVGKSQSITASKSVYQGVTFVADSDLEKNLYSNLTND